MECLQRWPQFLSSLVVQSFALWLGPISYQEMEFLFSLNRVWTCDLLWRIENSRCEVSSELHPVKPGSFSSHSCCPFPPCAEAKLILRMGNRVEREDPLKASPTTRCVSQATSDCLILGELPDSCCHMREPHQPLTHKGPQMRPAGGVPSWAQPRWSTTQHFEQINVYYLGPLHLRMIWQAVLQLTPPDCKMCPWPPKLRIHAGNRCHLASLLTLCFVQQNLDCLSVGYLDSDIFP